MDGEHRHVDDFEVTPSGVIVSIMEVTYAMADGPTQAELKGLQMSKLMRYAASGVLEHEAVEQLKELREARDKAKPGVRSSDERRAAHVSLCMEVVVGTVAPPLPHWANGWLSKV
jgi:hypothetical protein